MKSEIFLIYMEIQMGSVALIYKEIQMGSVAKSYMRKSFLI